MDAQPPSYEDIENGHPTQRPMPKTITNNLRRNANNSAGTPSGNVIYTVNAPPNVQLQQQQQLGNNTVYLAQTQGQPVYIIPQSAVDEARRSAQFRRNCILCFIITKLIVIVAVVIIVLSTQ